MINYYCLILLLQYKIRRIEFFKTPHKFFTIIKGSKVINEPKHITKFPCLPNVIVFHLVDPFTFIVKQKKICKEWGWIITHGNTKYFFK